MMRSDKAVALVVTLGLTTLLGTLPGSAAPSTPPAPPPLTASTPNTSGCPNRFAPPAPVDLSELPAPGAPAPTAVPVPDRPVGGPRLGKCGVILPPGAAALPDGISAASWVLVDAGSGEVLAAKDPHGRHRPASTIKLLTALLVTDRLPPDAVITATRPMPSRRAAGSASDPAAGTRSGSCSPDCCWSRVTTPRMPWPNGWAACRRPSRS